MSSVYVRQTFKAWLAANATGEKIIDLTAQFQELRDLAKAHGVSPGQPWLGVQFVGSDEIPVTVPATNTTGKYRETGAIYLHVVGPAQLGVGDIILTRGEVLRTLLRGTRIDQILVDSVTPMSFDEGTTLQFDGGYTSGSFILDYVRDLDL